MNAHLIAGIVIALCYFTIGLIMSTKAADPSRIFGYRTSAARRNMDTWLEANHFAGKSIMITGSILILLLMVFAAIIPEPEGFYPAIFCAIAVSTIAVFLLTESHLHKVFFKDGKRRPYR